MSGLYLHIPFCKSRCVYCGFYSTTQSAMRQRYVDALCREMELRQSEATTIDTVYLGGGTPSQLTAEQLQQLFSHIADCYRLNTRGADFEVTMEVNPDDVTDHFAELLAQLPVNRVSMGVQTFDDERLRFLRRRHTAAQALLAFRRLRRAGIANISIDLMYGFPQQTLADWLSDIEQAIALGAEHLSAYCLMVEEGTPLKQWLMENRELTKDNSSKEEGERRKENGQWSMVNGQWPLDEEVERQMYYALIDRLSAAGYEHYEISNFARRGYHSRHNSSYWHDVSYIGLGAAAHSYDRRARQWNVSDIRQYINAIEQGTVPSECECLDDDTRYNDRVTVALRTADGLDLGTLSPRHRHYCMQEARRFLDAGLLRMSADHLVLTREGLFLSDMVMSGLMLV